MKVTVFTANVKVSSDKNMLPHWLCLGIAGVDITGPPYRAKSHSLKHLSSSQLSYIIH